MKRFRIQLVWALIVLICGVSLMGMVYLVFNKPEVYINPGIVVTQPSPVAEPAAPLAPRGGSAPQSMFHHTSYSYTYHSPETNSFTGTGKGLYLHAFGRRRRQWRLGCCGFVRFGLFARDHLYAEHGCHDADDEFRSRSIDTSGLAAGSTGSTSDGAYGFTQTRSGTA